MSELNTEKVKQGLRSFTENTPCEMLFPGGSDIIRDTLALIKEYEQRIEDLETMIFAFVWNRGVAPIGKHLGKTDEEIADKVLETIREGEKKICYRIMRWRMQEAKARLEAKETKKGAEK